MLTYTPRFSKMVRLSSYLFTAPLPVSFFRVMAVMDQAVVMADGEAVMRIECQTLVVAFVQWIGQVRN